MKIKNRIKTRQDFQKLIREGKSLRNQEYVIYYRNNDLGYLRVGVSAPLKIGNAVTRVTVRRQIKAIVNKIIDINRPLDIIIIARKNFKLGNYLFNKSSLEKLINSIGD
jgi:ribonuclease P protein component